MFCVLVYWYWEVGHLFACGVGLLNVYVCFEEFLKTHYEDVFCCVISLWSMDFVMGVYVALVLFIVSLDSMEEVWCVCRIQ